MSPSTDRTATAEPLPADRPAPGARHVADPAKAAPRQPPLPPLVNALTIDVEDYFQVSAFERHVPRQKWDEYESRVVVNTHRLLRMLDRRGVRATFFVLGWVAHRFPHLVRDIHRAGHEIGSHSYWHRLIYELTPEEFAEDLRRSCAVLEDIVGAPVRSYRAPSFSITKKSLWALDLLAEHGLDCDSSVYAIYHDRYGIPDAHPWLHRLETRHGPLWEFPPTVLRLGRMNLPVGGGGYFRLYPLQVTVRCLERINRRDDRPFMFYLHPWEVDPDQPRLRVASTRSRFRHYVNLSTTAPKLEALLDRFSFGTMAEAIASQRARLPAEPPVPAVVAQPT